MSQQNTLSPKRQSVKLKTQDSGQQKAVHATTGIALETGPTYLALVESDLLVSQGTDLDEEGLSDDDLPEALDDPAQDLPDNELVEFTNDEDDFDSTQGGGLTRFLTYKEDPRWWTFDSQKGPHVFRIEKRPTDGKMQCLHRPKRWMVKSNDMSGLEQSKKTMRQQLDDLAKAFQEKMPTFLAYPSAATFAADWAEAIGFSANMPHLAELVPWSAKCFSQVICDGKAEESMLSRLRNSLLLVWPQWTLPLNSLWGGGFKLEVAQALLQEYARRASWIMPGAIEYVTTLETYRQDFENLNKKAQKKYGEGVMDSFSLRIVWEHTEKLKFSDTPRRLPQLASIIAGHNEAD